MPWRPERFADSGQVVGAEGGATAHSGARLRQRLCPGRRLRDWPWPATSSMPRRPPNSASRRSTWESCRDLAAPSVWRRLVGLGLAKDLCFTGRTIDAAEAQAIGSGGPGLPRRQLHGRMPKAAQDHGRKRARLLMRAMKQTIDRGFDLDLKSGLRPGSRCLWPRALPHPDAREGAAAFLEKRKPKFL